MQHRKPPFAHRPIVWDLQIAALLLGPPLAAAWIFASSAHPLAWIAGALLLLGSLTVAYGSFLEPLRLVLNKKVVQISALPALKIVIAADFHVGPYKDGGDVRRVVDLINAQNPDLVLLPGDFLFDHDADIAQLDPLKDLRARYGVWAGIGNHDTGHHATLRGERFQTYDRSADVAVFLRERGITLLRDEWREIATDRGAFALAAVDGPWSDMMSLDKAFAGIPPEMPVLLISHNPDVVLDPRHARADLIVSGHTHGGQIRLPLIGALHVPAETGKTYDQGIFRLNDRTTLAVTHGCGETLARARLLCPPEVMVIENRK